MKKPAAADHAVHELIAERWSPLAFDPTPLEGGTVRSLLEASRWAASSFNEQPWRFIVGDKASDPDAWQGVFDTLVPGNQPWAQHAPLLLIGVASMRYARGDKPNRHAYYDLGQATATLVLQATAMGLAAHQMGGFSPEAAQARFDIPQGFEAVAVTAIGRPGDGSLLDEAGRARDAAPRSRRPLTDLGFGTSWGDPAPVLG